MKKFRITSPRRGQPPLEVIIKVDDTDAYLLRSYVWGVYGGYIARYVGGQVIERLSHVITKAKPDDVVGYRDNNPLNLQRDNLIVGSRAEIRAEKS